MVFLKERFSSNFRSLEQTYAYTDTHTQAHTEKSLLLPFNKESNGNLILTLILKLILDSILILKLILN